LAAVPEADDRLETYARLACGRIRPETAPVKVEGERLFIALEALASKAA